MLHIAFECTNLSPRLESLNKMAIMFMIKPWFDFHWAARVDCNKTSYFYFWMAWVEQTFYHCMWYFLVNRKVSLITNISNQPCTGSLHCITNLSNFFFLLIHFHCITGHFCLLMSLKFLHNGDRSML